MLITRHGAERAVAIRDFDGIRRIKFKPNSAAVAVPLIDRHYCPPMGLPGGSAFGAGMAADPV